MAFMPLRSGIPRYVRGRYGYVSVERWLEYRCLSLATAMLLLPRLCVDGPSVDGPDKWIYADPSHLSIARGRLYHRRNPVREGRGWEDSAMDEKNQSGERDAPQKKQPRDADEASKGKDESQVDETLDDSFPASDPPAWNG